MSYSVIAFKHSDKYTWFLLKIIFFSRFFSMINGLNESHLYISFESEMVFFFVNTHFF